MKYKPEPLGYLVYGLPPILGALLGAWLGDLLSAGNSFPVCGLALLGFLAGAILPYFIYRREAYFQSFLEDGKWQAWEQDSARNPRLPLYASIFFEKIPPKHREDRHLMYVNLLYRNFTSYLHKDGRSLIKIYFRLSHKGALVARRTGNQLTLEHYDRIRKDYEGAPELPSEAQNRPDSEMLVVTGASEVEARANATRLLNPLAIIEDIKLWNRNGNELQAIFEKPKRYLAWVKQPEECPSCGKTTLLVRPSGKLKEGVCGTCRWQGEFEDIRKCASCQQHSFLSLGSKQGGHCVRCPHVEAAQS